MRTGEEDVMRMQKNKFFFWQKLLVLPAAHVPSSSGWTGFASGRNFIVAPKLLLWKCIHFIEPITGQVSSLGKEDLPLYLRSLPLSDSYPEASSGVPFRLRELSIAVSPKNAIQSKVVVVRETCILFKAEARSTNSSCNGVSLKINPLFYSNHYRLTLFNETKNVILPNLNLTSK